jgi:hypothetical protein
MKKNEIFIIAAISLILTSCSSTQPVNSTDKVIYRSTIVYKPKISFEFSAFDANGNGQVNFKEWKRGFSLLLKDFDEDGNGSFESQKGDKIDFKWMNDANKNRDTVISPSELNVGLKKIFENASGTNSLISKREFRSFSWVTGETYARKRKSVPKK